MTRGSRRASVWDVQRLCANCYVMLGLNWKLQDENEFLNLETCTVHLIKEWWFSINRWFSLQGLDGLFSCRIINRQLYKYRYVVWILVLWSVQSWRDEFKEQKWVLYVKVLFDWFFNVTCLTLKLYFKVGYATLRRDDSLSKSNAVKVWICCQG